MELSALQFHKQIGDHIIFCYDLFRHPFIEYFQKLYNSVHLENIHEQCKEYISYQNGELKDISDYETELHKLFYTDIKSNNTFKTLYCNFIKMIHNALFDKEQYMIYQSFPSIRFQFPGNIAVPPHYDSDEIGQHPNGEKNFLIPITSMYGTKRLYIESSPGEGDCSGIDLKYGDLFYFNGNKCLHYNETNRENSLRISLDFRMMTISDYKKYILSGKVTTTNPRDPDKKRVPTKMIIGGYYQLTHIDDTLSTMLEWHFQKDLILQSRPVFDEKEALACYHYLLEDNFVTEFKYTEQFEKELASFIGAKHCIATTSGNSAIILALMSLNLQPGDEVIVPNYTMIATINSVKMVGATPIIADVTPDTWTLSVESIKKNVTARTKAVLHVSLNNRHCDITSIQKYCKEHCIILMEDAAQSLGCFVHGKHFGTFGEMGCFSLSTPKIISTGQGGFIVTDNDELAKKIRMIKNFGRKDSGNDIFETFGINLKFTDLQAVLGLEQLKKVPARIKRLRDIFNLYYDNLKHVCPILPPQSESWFPWFVDIFVTNRDELMLFLKNHNIQTRATYPEINKTPMYLSDNTLEHSHAVSSNGLFLPTHMKLTDNEIHYICKMITLFYVCV
jgi:perosamine synthetase